MQSSGTMISDLLAAVLKDDNLSIRMAQEYCNSDEDVRAHIQRVMAVRQEMAELLVGMIDPTKIKDAADFGIAEADFRLRVAKAVVALNAGHDQNPKLSRLYWSE